MSRKRTQCPHCGNTDPQYRQDNGCTGPNLTYLCVKPCEVGESSFDAAIDAQQLADGYDVVCGAQWDAYDWED